MAGYAGQIRLNVMNSVEILTKVLTGEEDTGKAQGTWRVIVLESWA